MTTKFSQIESPNLFSAIVTSVARVSVLRVFLIDPTRAYYQRQLETATGTAIRGVQRELEKMTESGLLYRRLEGKRAYYSIDTAYPGFEHLRELFLAGAENIDVLRAALTTEPSVQLLFRESDDGDFLIVTHDGITPPQIESDKRFATFELNTMSTVTFIETLYAAPEELAPYLRSGEDLLGRRDDIIWRRIEAAGFIVEKGKGIP